MHITDLYELEQAISKISNLTDTNREEIVNALIGIAWDEESAGNINQFILDGD